MLGVTLKLKEKIATHLKFSEDRILYVKTAIIHDMKLSQISYSES